MKRYQEKVSSRIIMVCKQKSKQKFVENGSFVSFKLNTQDYQCLTKLSSNGVYIYNIPCRVKLDVEIAT